MPEGKDKQVSGRKQVLADVQDIKKLPDTEKMPKKKRGRYL
jgi:hypothetical protein